MKPRTKTQEYLRNVFHVLLTIVLSPIFYLGVFFNKIRSRKGKLKILVIQRGKIGDVVCSTGIFKAIKEKYPNSYLAVLTTDYTSDIIANNPYIDEIIKFDERRSGTGYFMDIVKKIEREKFRFSISLQSTTINSILSFWSMIPYRISVSSPYAPVSSKILSIFNSHNAEFRDENGDMTFRHWAKLLKFLDINVPIVRIDLYTDEKSESKAENFLKEKGLSENDFLVGICPTTGNKLKEWDLEKWIALSNLLIENLKARIILIGGPGDSDIISKIQQGTMMRAIDSSGVFALGEIAAFLKKMKICVTSFSAPMHIADGVGTPIVAIAGPSSLDNQPPIGEKTKIVYQSIYCHPCDFFTKTSRFCKEGHYRCLKETSVDEVYRAITDLMGKK